MRLYEIQEQVESRFREIEFAHGGWPCRKGCDDCCRSLASEPRVSRQEWLALAAAINALPEVIAEYAWQRIRESAGAARPVVCPLLDSGSGACLVYDSRPIACRAYGFYAERGEVLGCGRIEALAEESCDIVWGNHQTLADRMREFEPVRTLAEWMGAQPHPQI